MIKHPKFVFHSHLEYMNPHYINLGTNHTEYYTIIVSYNYISNIFPLDENRNIHPSSTSLIYTPTSKNQTKKIKFTTLAAMQKSLA